MCLYLFHSCQPVGSTDDAQNLLCRGEMKQPMLKLNMSWLPPSVRLQYSKQSSLCEQMFTGLRLVRMQLLTKTWVFLVVIVLLLICSFKINQFMQTLNSLHLRFFQVSLIFIFLTFCTAFIYFTSNLNKNLNFCETGSKRVKKKKSSAADKKNLIGRIK